MSQRSERISDEFQKALSEAIRTLKDPRVHEAMVSVTRCEVTGDLRYAKAYISVFGDEQQKKDVMRGLKSAAAICAESARPRFACAMHRKLCSRWMTPSRTAHISTMCCMSWSGRASCDWLGIPHRTAAQASRSRFDFDASPSGR